jgi:hypothetical protein
MLALTILQGQLNFSLEKIHPIASAAIFVGGSTIRLLSF